MRVASKLEIWFLIECSHWSTRTQIPTPTKWVCNPFASVSVSMLVSLNSSAYYNWTHLLSVSVSVSVSTNVNTPLPMPVDWLLARCNRCCSLKRILVVTEFSYIAVNDPDAKKSARYRWVLVLAELFISGTQCTVPLKSVFIISVQLSVSVYT